MDLQESMSLKDIIQSLDKESQAEIKKIKQEAASQEKELKSEHKLRLKQARSQILVKAEKEIAKQAEMELFAKQAELRQNILKKRRELLDEVYERALEKLKSISESDYQRLLSKLIKKVPSSGTIVPAKGKKEVIQQVALKIFPGFKISEESKEITGGFIWQSDEMSIDNSWPELINQLREQTETQIAKSLFSN